MEHSVDVHLKFWRDALLAGGFAAIPRWTLDPVPGVAANEVEIPDGLVARLHRLSRELDVPLSSVLLAAQAKVRGRLAVLMLVDNIRTAHSREPFEGPREVVVGLAEPVNLADCSPTVEVALP